MVPKPGRRAAGSRGALSALAANQLDAIIARFRRTEKRILAYIFDRARIARRCDKSANHHTIAEDSLQLAGAGFAHLGAGDADDFELLQPNQFLNATIGNPRSVEP